MDEKTEKPMHMDPGLSTPKLEADKLMQELMVNSQKALIDMMRKSGVSNDALNELRNDLSEGETPLPMTEDVSWNEYLMSSEEQKQRITQASKEALSDFQQKVKNSNVSTLASAQMEPLEKVTPDMEILMSGINQNKQSEIDHE